MRWPAAGNRRGRMLNWRPTWDHGLHWATTVVNTVMASPPIRSVTIGPPGTIKDDLRARVAVHASPNPPRYTVSRQSR